MKKFSKITNQKINEEPKAKNILCEEDIFKNSVMSLIEQLLVIRSYGPIDRYFRAGSVKITGKEVFVEALMDLMTDKSLKDKVKLLEGLKSNISDWETLDRRIDEVNIQINESKNIDKGKMMSHRKRIIDLYKIYKDDKETLMSQIDEMSDKIKNGEKAFWRGIAAEHMASEGKFPKTIMKEIADKFYFRSRQLGYKK
jgi:hypothetical protein